MNLGVQVVVVCERPPASWPSSPLARLMQEGVATAVASPGPIDRLSALRSLVTRDALVVEAADLHSLAEAYPTWRALENGLRAHLHAPSDAVPEVASEVTGHVQTATAVLPSRSSLI